MNVLAVFLGGGLGSLARYGIGYGLVNWGYASPWSTLLSNICATAILMGILANQQSLDATSRWSATWVLLLTTGFCGGFSTFSTFSADTIQLAQSNGLHWAAANVGANLVLCLGLGYWSWATVQAAA